MNPVMKSPVIFVSGVPGAGCNTVSQTLSAITGYHVINPGELVRKEAANITTLRGMQLSKMLIDNKVSEVINFLCFKFKGPTKNGELFSWTEWNEQPSSSSRCGKAQDARQHPMNMEKFMENVHFFIECVILLSYGTQSKNIYILLII